MNDMMKWTKDDEGKGGVTMGSTWIFLALDLGNLVDLSTVTSNLI